MTDGAKHLSHTAGSRRWHEVEDDDGTILYVSYHPRFILRYYAWLTPQKIIYREWEEEITFTGDDLSATFQNLKAAKPATIKRGLQPDGSTILSIKSLWRP